MCIPISLKMEVNTVMEQKRLKLYGHLWRTNLRSVDTIGTRDEKPEEKLRKKSIRLYTRRYKTTTVFNKKILKIDITGWTCFTVPRTGHYDRQRRVKQTRLKRSVGDGSSGRRTGQTFPVPPSQPGFLKSISHELWNSRTYCTMTTSSSRK